MGNNCTKAGKEEQDLLRHAKEGHVDAVTQVEWGGLSMRQEETTTSAHAIITRQYGR